jgi:hypothetical protein
MKTARATALPLVSMKLIRPLLLSLGITVSCAVAPQTLIGTYDCGRWFTAGAVARAWLLGYLSGLNLILGDAEKKYDPLAKIGSAQQIYLWMDNYCKANPLSKINEGAKDLYQELQKE